MPSNLFGDVVNPSVKTVNRSGLTVAVTMIAEVLILIAIVVVPLMASGVLPNPATTMSYTITEIKLPSPPPPPRTRKDEPLPNEPSDPSKPPDVTPPDIRPETPFEEPDFEREKTIGGVTGGKIDEFEPPPPPPEAKKEVSKEPLRVGGDVKPPQKVRHVNPVYPPIAQSARVQGIVIIEAMISPSGDVQSARVLRGVPLLDEAALQAVSGWKFTPTLLNGTPVPVLMTVTVQFTLQ